MLDNLTTTTAAPARGLADLDQPGDPYEINDMDGADLATVLWITASELDDIATHVPELARWSDALHDRAALLGRFAVMLDPGWDRRAHDAIMAVGKAVT